MPCRRSHKWIPPTNMRPGHGATGGEGHRLAYCTQPREPLTMTDPAPALDEVISDPGHQTMWGKLLEKNCIRICFQNVGGIIPTMDGNLKLTVLQHFTQQHQIDVCWDVIPKQQQLVERTRGWWENANWTTAFNKRDKNPIAHQPGGTGILVVNQFSH